MSNNSAVVGREIEFYVAAIRRRFGSQFDLILKVWADMLVLSVIDPEGGGNVGVFDDVKLAWVDSGQDFTYWTVYQGGSVNAGYLSTSVCADNGWFQLGHPREFAEILHLFRQPLRMLQAPINVCRPIGLGTVADLYALIRDEDAKRWRALSLSRLPAGIPRPMCRDLERRLAQDYNAMTGGGYYEPESITEKWSVFCEKLPDARLLLQDGYVLQKDRSVEWALGLSTEEGSRFWSTYVPVLVVPHEDKVSALFLREFLIGDDGAWNHLQDCFSGKHSLTEIGTRLKRLPVMLPTTIMDQIRLGAQTNLMREVFLREARRLANSRTPFGKIGMRQRSAIKDLRRMTVT
jgi:hypothetical protein